MANRTRVITRKRKLIEEILIDLSATYTSESSIYQQVSLFLRSKATLSNLLALRCMTLSSTTHCRVIAEDDND